ncbi:MAG: anaerobic ribonucleoside-triphosphate reductase [Actinobacteria bacterium]|nr:anaerobic ribonucleoside-triphosphate reductase [Actinomycetota bacterium]
MKKLYDLIDDVLENKTWLLRENSNTQMSPSLIDLYISSQINEEYALNKLYSEDVVKHHKNGSIYIHTLHSPFRPYCNGIDARIFLLDGLKFPHCRSAPPKHFSSAVYQAMAYLFYTQLFFSGAQAIDYFNWFFAPFIRKDELSYEEVKQVIQGFVFQLNQSNRTGAQSAFSNVGLRIKCPPYLENEQVILDGKKENYTYSEFEKEARTIYRAFMEVMGEGDGMGLPFTFPIITTAITKDFNWEDELVDATMEAASKTGAPYFLNLAASYLDEKYVHAMCCRLLVEHSAGVWMAGGLGTGSNKVVTLNLPHIALEAKEEKKFFDRLDHNIDIARQALLESNAIVKTSIEKWKILSWLEMKTDDNAPYYNFDERRLTVGVVGLNECLVNLIDKPLVSSEGRELGLTIIKHIAAKTKEASEKDGVIYTLEQTPAESASHKLATIDVKRFDGSAFVQGETGSFYYTNSSHVPYSEDVSIFDKIEVESKFHPFFTGGAICHIWMGESLPSVSALKNFVKKLSQTDLAYFALSPDFSICRNNHLSRGKTSACSSCGSEIVDYVSRVVGYFTRISKWNPGKQQEYHNRKRFKI